MWDHTGGRSAVGETQTDVQRKVIKEFGRIVGTARDMR